MADLPQRFVPTSSKFINPERIVSQCGHGCGITAVRFSPDFAYFASADEDGWVKVWVLETLDILGSYLLDFVCTSLEWDNLDALVCRGNGEERRIVLGYPDAEHTPEPGIADKILMLLGRPELSNDGHSVHISYNDEAFDYELPNLVRVQMEPTERYFVAFSRSRLIIGGTFENEIRVELQAAENQEWIDFSIASRGNEVAVVSNDGGIYHIDPLKNVFKRVNIGKIHVNVCDFAIDRYILCGDDRGNLTVYDIAGRSVALRTPRLPQGFESIWPSPDKIGFMALRPESATAFLGNSQEILSSAPLPAPLSAACAGQRCSEIIASCTDLALYRLKLDENKIAKLCKTQALVDVMAVNGDYMLFHDVTGRMTFVVGNKQLMLDWTCAQKPLSLAIADNGQTMAALFDEEIVLATSSKTGKTTTRAISAQNVAAISFGKEKSASLLYIFMQDLRIQTLNIKNDERADLPKLPLEHARLASLAPASKSFIYALLVTEHGHNVVLKIGLNSGKASEVLRIITHGRQIWAASMSPQTVSLRNDADCLRIISDLHAYSIDDWARCEPLAIS